LHLGVGKQKKEEARRSEAQTIRQRWQARRIEPTKEKEEEEKEEEEEGTVISANIDTLYKSSLYDRTRTNPVSNLRCAASGRIHACCC